jgi:hypothetical protein
MCGRFLLFSSGDEIAKLIFNSSFPFWRVEAGFSPGFSGVGPQAGKT